MLIKTIKINDIKSSEITSESSYYARRDFLKSLTAIGGGIALGSLALESKAKDLKISEFKENKWTKEYLGESLTSFDDITNYNNFYEFGTSKTDPSKNAKDFKSKPWTIIVDGLCGNPGRYSYDQIIRTSNLEERVYRFRCVEAWSMVVPWVGVPLKSVINLFNPLSKAKYVAFETLLDPKQMPGQKSNVLEWPYREGLRFDEAINPLALLAVGIYGKELPNQNGAPIRLVVPWKYGFKSIKSIVRISFSEHEPQTSWNMASASEYGFYSNVNPEVSHPRWSQKKERRIGEFFKQPSLMFNGYQNEVESLYEGMNLRKFF